MSEVTPGKEHAPVSAEGLASSAYLMVAARLLLVIGGPIGAFLLGIIGWQITDRLASIDEGIKEALSGVQQNSVTIAVVQDRGVALESRVATLEQVERERTTARRN